MKISSWPGQSAVSHWYSSAKTAPDWTPRRNPHAIALWACQRLQGRGRARGMRDDRPMSVETGTKRKEGGFAETVRVVFHALIIAVVIRTFLFQPFNIPSGSMIPTLLVGDYLFVSKYSYGYTHYSLPFSPDIFSGRIPSSWTPQRGDVVVFRLPKDDSIDYIKRLIGLPGDRIQMIDGVLNINGTPVKREQHRRLRDRRRRRRAARQAFSRDAAERGQLYDHRSHRQRLLRQHAGLHGAARTIIS